MREQLLTRDIMKAKCSMVLKWVSEKLMRLKETLEEMLFSTNPFIILFQEIV
tara:strand:- start:517 stop:672 length:156 start_codon:yes stop_codon:yes gene_type:complete